MKIIFKDQFLNIEKRKRYLLSIVLLFGIVILIILAQFYYNIQEKSFNQKVEDVFKEVLLQQLGKYSVEGYFYSSERKNQHKEYPDTVYMTGPNGKRAYCLTREKSSKNITSDPRLRFLHSICFSEHHFIVDSLYKSWKKYLEQKKLPVSNLALQLFISDEDEHITNNIVPNDFILGNAIGNFYITAGYRCEIEFKGFFTPSFFYLVGIKGLLYTSIYLLFLTFIIIFIFKSNNNIKKIIVTESAHLYQLDENILFDANQRKLIVGKEEIPMFPQTATLLNYFLESSDYFLKDEDIQNLFWSDKLNNVTKLHNTIGRLRKVFDNIPSINIQRCEKKGYQLHIVRQSESQPIIIDEKEDN